jgi:hypothetical protein
MYKSESRLPEEATMRRSSVPRRRYCPANSFAKDALLPGFEVRQIDLFSLGPRRWRQERNDLAFLDDLHLLAGGYPANHLTKGVPKLSDSRCFHD